MRFPKTQLAVVLRTRSSCQCTPPASLFRYMHRSSRCCSTVVALFFVLLVSRGCNEEAPGWSSVLQVPSCTLPLASTESANPGGQYVVELLCISMLCRQMRAGRIASTVSGLALMGDLRILHLWTRIPKVFSIVLRALESR